jgi:hypothetical protein
MEEKKVSELWFRFMNTIRGPLRKLREEYEIPVGSTEGDLLKYEEKKKILEEKKQGKDESRIIFKTRLDEIEHEVRFIEYCVLNFVA